MLGSPERVPVIKVLIEGEVEIPELDGEGEFAHERDVVGGGRDAREGGVINNDLLDEKLTFAE
jgi:hypothetical protein